MQQNTIQGQTLDEERALYNLSDAEVRGCTFSGPADGESALKEGRNLDIINCQFLLRYPLWHTRGFRLENSFMDVAARAALWYSRDGVIEGCTLNGIKCLRECDNISLSQCSVNSLEFGWKCRGLKIKDSEMESEYFLLDSENIHISRLKMKGKYSFQYTKNMTIENSVLDTKDAFWHSVNTTVQNSVVKGEYLGWYSDGLTLINCQIIGTQPLCYCKNLTLIGCTMEETDLAFECSDVRADVMGSILSVKNPRSGTIVADSIGEIIIEEPVMDTSCKVSTRRQ